MMLDFAVFFRYEDEGFTSEVIEDSSDWVQARHLPRIGEDLYLGKPGAGFYWYTVKAVRWFDAHSVTMVVHKRRDQIE
jgi:hypothetical protein